MKEFEHLDKALEFLRDRDEGSFSYYRDEPNSIGLINFLDSIGILEIDRLKLLLHLAQDGYIEIHPDSSKLQGHFPNQLKINYKGKLFINNGGYKKENEKKRAVERRFWIPIIISTLSFLLALA